MKHTQTQEKGHQNQKRKTKKQRKFFTQHLANRQEEGKRQICFLPVSEANVQKLWHKTKALVKHKKGNQHTYHFIHRKDRLKTEEKSSIIRETDNRNFKKIQQHKLFIPKEIYQQTVSFIRSHKEPAHCYNCTQQQFWYFAVKVIKNLIKNVTLFVVLKTILSPQISRISIKNSKIM